MRTTIATDQAPKPSGTYSQAIKCDNVVYTAGQIALDPKTNEMITGDFRKEAEQVFKNLAAVCAAASGSLASIVRLTIYLTNLNDFPIVNEIMQQYFQAPYPARTTFQVSALPKSATIEVDAILHVK